MVDASDVEKFFKQHFPSCPLCGADEGYEVSGWAKTYVQCNSCGAKWMSNDFPKLKQIKNMSLWELPMDGRGAIFLKKKKSIEFWLNVDLKSPEFQPTPRCPKCDVQITGWICSNCKSTVSLSMQSCPKCGSNREAVITCAKCKTPLTYTQDDRLVIADTEKLKEIASKTKTLYLCPKCDAPLGKWICPKCKTHNPLSVSSCPKCGFERPFITCSSCKTQLFWEDGKLTQYQPVAGISLDSTDDVLRSEIKRSLANLKMHEAGTGWGGLAVLLSGSAGERMMAQMLKALVDQNKIIIRQNELLLRALDRVLANHDEESATR